MSSKDFSQPIREITVQELATRLKTSTSKLQLLDVREPLEVEMASIAGFEVLPKKSIFRMVHTDSLSLRQGRRNVCHVPSRDPFRPNVSMVDRSRFYQGQKPGWRDRCLLHTGRSDCSPLLRNCSGRSGSTVN